MSSPSDLSPFIKKTYIIFISLLTLYSILAVFVIYIECYVKTKDKIYLLIEIPLLIVSLGIWVYMIYKIIKNKLTIDALFNIHIAFILLILINSMAMSFYGSLSKNIDSELNAKYKYYSQTFVIILTIWIFSLMCPSMIE